MDMVRRNVPLKDIDAGLLALFTDDGTTRSATSPRNTLWRYLVIQTIWRWMENVVWEPWR